MNLISQPVRIATGSDEDGVLVFDGQQRLVAVLVLLSSTNEVAPGRWFLEAGFGRLDGPEHPTFAHLDEAESWISGRLEALALRGASAAERPRTAE